MRFKRFTGTNFIVFPEISLDFSGGLTLVDGWNHDSGQANGAGKSILFNALAYSVYGKMTTDVNLADLIPEGGAQTVSTEVELVVPIGTITVFRTRNPAGLRLVVNGEEFKGTTQKLEDRIVSLTGLSFEQFLKVSYFWQGARDRFIDVNDTEKKSFLASVLGLDQCETAYKSVHTKLTATEKRLATREHGCDLLRSAVVSRTKDLTEVRLRLSAYEESYDAKKLELEKAYEPKDDGPELESLQKAVDLAQKVVDNLPPAADKVSLVAKQTLHAKAIQALYKIKYDVQDLEKSIAKFRHQLEHVPETCEACSQDLPESRVTGFRKGIQKQLDVKTAELVTASEKLTKAERIVDSTKHATNDLALAERAEKESINALNALDRAKKALFARELTYASLKQVQEKAKKEALLALEQRRTDLVYEAERADNNLAITEYELREEENKGAVETEELSYLRTVKSIFSPVGLRAHVVDGVVNELNERIAHYIEILFGGIVSFWYELDESGKLTGKLTYAGRDRSTIATLSGGQRQRVRLAVDLALADVVSNRLAVRPNVLVLDEVTENMDSTGREAFMTLLQELEQNRDLILVADHESELKTRFTRSLKIDLENGRATISNGV